MIDVRILNILNFSVFLFPCWSYHLNKDDFIVRGDGIKCRKHALISTTLMEMCNSEMLSTKGQDVVLYI